LNPGSLNTTVSLSQKKGTQKMKKRKEKKRKEKNVQNKMRKDCYLNCGGVQPSA
jgi:hypothetical protein